MLDLYVHGAGGRGGGQAQWGRMWRGEVKNQVFVDVINGWPLTVGQVCHSLQTGGKALYI